MRNAAPGERTRWSSTVEAYGRRERSWASWLRRRVAFTRCLCRGPQFGHGRNDLAAHHLERPDPVHADDPAEDRFHAHAGEPSKALDDLARLGAVFAQVEAERCGLLDRVIVAN